MTANTTGTDTAAAKLLQLARAMAEDASSSAAAQSRELAEEQLKRRRNGAVQLAKQVMKSSAGPLAEPGNWTPLAADWGIAEEVPGVVYGRHPTGVLFRYATINGHTALSVACAPSPAQLARHRSDPESAEFPPPALVWETVNYLVDLGYLLYDPSTTVLTSPPQRPDTITADELLRAMMRADLFDRDIAVADPAPSNDEYDPEQRRVVGGPADAAQPFLDVYREENDVAGRRFHITLTEVTDR